MKTGEGKTLVSTLAGYLNALSGRQRAHRHRERLPRPPRLRVDGPDLPLPRHGGRPDPERHAAPTQKTPAYKADVTYGTNSEFGFDYLRDNMVTRAAARVQRGHHFAIVDEVDSILIDEARTPLIISGAGTQRGRHLQQVRPRHAAPRARRGLRDGRGQEDHQRHRESALRRSSPRSASTTSTPTRPASSRTTCSRRLKAQFLFHRDVDYVVVGRRSEDRRRVHGPHHGGPPLLRGPAPGARGQRARARARGEPDARDHHAAELLPPLREALRHDRYRHDRGRGVPRDLQAAGRRPSRRTGPVVRIDENDLVYRTIDAQVQRRRRRRRRAPCGGSALPDRHRLHRELRAPVPPARQARHQARDV